MSFETFELAGATNFRDLGGYMGEGGRRVRRGVLLRSDHLGALTDPDRALLARTLGPALRVCDFRGATERQAAACVIEGAAVHSLAIEPTIVQKLTSLLAAGHALTAQETVALMQETYRGFVRGNTHRFAELFAHLLTEPCTPLVFHCTAGKDRTGFAAALVLSALGVAPEVVMADYLLTNARLKAAPTARAGVPPEILSVLYRVQAEFLQAALEAVDQDFGGMDAYLRDAIGLDAAGRARLQRLYLEA